MSQAPKLPPLLRLSEDQIDRLLSYGKNACLKGDFDRLCAQARLANALAEWVKEYGDHSDDCHDAKVIRSAPCSCGLAKLMEEI